MDELEKSSRCGVAGRHEMILHQLCHGTIFQIEALFQIGRE